MAWWAFEGFSVSVAGSDCGDGSSITAGVELGHGGFGEVAAVGDLPFVVHVGQHRADEADDGRLVGEDPDHPGITYEFASEFGLSPAARSRPEDSGFALIRPRCGTDRRRFVVLVGSVPASLCLTSSSKVALGAQVSLQPRIGRRAP